MFHRFSSDVALPRILSLGAALLFSAGVHATTKTWTGNFDHQSWSESGNWNPAGQPGSGDDVIHNNSDTIHMNVGSQSTPAVINSYTATGSAGGALVIDANKGLKVTNDFTNSSTGFADRYLVTMSANSRLDVGDGSTLSDLTRVSVAMAAVTSGDPTTLNVTGAILNGEFTVNEGCEVMAGTDDDADKSVIEGEWKMLDGGHLTFAAGFQSSVDEPPTVTLDGGSVLTVLIGAYEDASTFFDGTDPLPAELFYGDGENVLEMGSAQATSAALELDCLAIIRPLTNSGLLKLSLKSSLIPHTNFTQSLVHSNWDTRAVDVSVLPFTQTQSHGNLEAISPELKDYFEGPPVVFLDVACHGAWRDLVIHDAGEEEAWPVGVYDEWESAFIDDFRTGCSGIHPHSEVSIVRDVYIGQGRILVIEDASVVGQPRIYFYGTRTIDPDGAVYHGTTEVTDEEEIDELIVAACGTLYGDWNGDCAITVAEYNALLDTIDEEAYNPLYDSNCDGGLTRPIEGAKLWANYLAQPECECGGESLSSFSGGASLGSEAMAAFALRLTDGLSGPQISLMIYELIEAIDAHDEAPIVDDMLALLTALAELE